MRDVSGTPLTLPEEAGPDRNDPAADAANAVQDSFAAPLRAMYEPYEKQPIPDEHVALLLALRWKERERQVGLR
jgi:hypothetical protein